MSERQRTYRVTGTWGTGDEHVSVGDLVVRDRDSDRLTVCVGDSDDRSAITGTYFLQAIDRQAPETYRDAGYEVVAPVWFYS